jgi:hypothetical protein
VQQDIYYRIRELFEQQDIQFTYPWQTLYVVAADGAASGPE